MTGIIGTEEPRTALLKVMDAEAPSIEQLNPSHKLGLLILSTLGIRREFWML